MPFSTRYQRVLTITTLVGSGALVGGLFTTYLLYESQLALAQAADSFLDVFTAAVLTWTVAVAAQPEDEEHPFGHSRAEPIGGLVTAVIAAVLAIEVARSAGTALLSGYQPKLEMWLVYVFAIKVVFKLGIFGFSSKAWRNTGSPAMRALRVDARNDVLVSSLAIGGFFAARAGIPEIDAWLALPVAAWIAWSGIDLARENIRYLMGEAPTRERQAELEDIARTTPGVKQAHDLRAHFLGTELQVQVHVVVDPALTVKAAHDIGEAVRERLESERDVRDAHIHIDID
jgi:cation diffusion facilitator family transporter